MFLLRRVSQPAVALGCEDTIRFSNTIRKLVMFVLQQMISVKCATEIVIIGPKPHQSTHFLYTIENSPMDFSREAKHQRTLSNSNVSRGEKLHEV